jgi:hypothetical protein
MSFSLHVRRMLEMSREEPAKRRRFAMADERWPQLQPGKPATYRISVEGALDEKWSSRLGGMQIATEERECQKPVTTLSGQVPDQAALIGVLNSLYELHLNILSVICETACEKEGSH